MNDTCVHCLTKLEPHPTVCMECREAKSWCTSCLADCSVQNHKKKTIILNKGTDCKNYCPKCKVHTDMVFKGFKDPQHDPWCVGVSINSNKPADPNFMPFTKHNRLITSQQIGEYPEKSGRKVVGGVNLNMEERYAEKWIAWDAGKFCGGY